jgi:anti-sigma factor ChrR (cupin superfamily)
MRHPDEGRLRAYCDGALDAAEHEKVQLHLASCRRCGEQAAIIQARGHRVHLLLAALEPQTKVAAVAPRVARQRLEAYDQERKERRMARNPFSRRYRPAWAAAVLVMLVVVTLTVPSIRSVAGNLLGLFRVQKIEFTAVSEEALPDEEALQAVAPEIERMFDETLTITTEGDQERVTEASARERAEFPVRLPAAGQENARYEWTPPMYIAFQVDLPQIQAVFAELGYQDIDLPTALDDETVEADFAGMLTVSYGACSQDAPAGDDCMTFVQMPSPSATVPHGLDINQLGRVYLELLGMPVEEATRLSERIDWTTTLVLPFPHHVNLTHETVRVDGVDGTLIHSQSSYRPTPEYLLTWVKDDIIYAVAGKGDFTQALELAASLR